ncbi:protein WALLS ARE THIN 1 [Ziziphus jujuba]|uniref:WAT1-related protein n=1 Tax=Ziziphus jujuba TaxID=326968 RepID=A0ABM4AEC4_ZIZJJ|nr:protein WALLS ARE THIN 1 [Ziziphus jujuba]
MAEAGWGRKLCTVPERAKLHIALVVYQFGYSGNHIIFRAALNMGVSKLVLPLYRNSIAVFLLFPFAYFFRKVYRPPLTISFLVQFFLLGLVGITLNHLSYILGLAYTSPTFASAIENSVPAVTFLIAILFRLEQVRLDRRDGIAKVLGTLASVVGASIITLYKGPTIYSPTSNPNQSHHLVPSLGDSEDKNWTLGCIYCIVHCICWSSWVVLQAPVLKKYPARLSLTSCTCFFGALQLLGISATLERDHQAWQVHSGGELLCILYAGFVSSGMAFAIQIWVVDKGGPVFFSLYLPLQTLLVAIMATVLLGEEFYLGGILGALLIILGLYLVVWGKNKESELGNDGFPSPSDKGMSQSKSSLVQSLLPTSNKWSTVLM